MNPPALYFASGESLYPGVAFLVLAIATEPFRKGRGLALFRTIATWLGLAMIVMASPPVSGWMAVSFAAIFVLWIVASGRAQSRILWTGLRKTSAAILLGMLLVLLASELFYRRMPNIHGVPADHLVIIGDSISAGVDPSVPNWPRLLQQETGVPVENLSQAGATMAATEQVAAKVTPQDTALLIEIGGNDLLMGVSSREFERGLDSLLRGLAVPGRTLVMFELPLLPHWIAYGRVQRRLAEQYGVFLIPKHCFASVLSGADATSDGLHLSAVGAQRMADLVGRVLAPILKPAATVGAHTSP